jgi:hypothetical protein
MAALTIDVEAQIECLSGLKGDLDECFWAVDAADAHVRYALGIAITQLAQRIAALDEVVRHLGGGEAVRIADLSLDETRAVERALEILDGEIVLDASDAERRLWPRFRLVLAAADDLLIAAARGECAHAVDHDSGPRPGIVIPLVRSSR